MTPSRTTGAFILGMGQVFSHSSRAVFSAFISLGSRALKVSAVCVIGAMLMWEVLLEEAPECLSEFSIEIAVLHRKCLGQTRALIEINTNLLGFLTGAVISISSIFRKIAVQWPFTCCCLFFRGVFGV